MRQLSRSPTGSAGLIRTPPFSSVGLRARTVIDSGSDRLLLYGANRLADAYDVREPIGSGGFGEVRRGVDKRSGVVVAIKTMSKARANRVQQETLTRLRREVDHLKSVSGCKGVARFLDCFEDEDSVHLVTEICNGGDLDDHVKVYGPLDEKRLAVVASEVLQVLDCCHSSGIVFADVKPGNLCLTNSLAETEAWGNSELLNQKNTFIKAVDFGCSRRIGSRRLNALTGTPAFMAPEVFRRDSAYKADVWSLGMTLYWLYAARFPFWDNTEMVSLTEIWQVDYAVSKAPMRYDYGPWLHMTAEGLNFVSACLTRRESDRLTVFDALRHPWLAAATHYKQNCKINVDM